MGLEDAWDAFWASWVANIQQPLLSLLAGCNGFIALLLGLLPELPLGGQFLPHPLESLFDNPLFAVHALNRLIPGEPLVGQFGLDDAGYVTLIPVIDRDGNLSIPDEAPTLWM